MYVYVVVSNNENDLNNVKLITIKKEKAYKLAKIIGGFVEQKSMENSATDSLDEYHVFNFLVWKNSLKEVTSHKERRYYTVCKNWNSKKHNIVNVEERRNTYKIQVLIEIPVFEDILEAYGIAELLFNKKLSEIKGGKIK